MDEEHFTTKSVKELRAILQRRKVDCSDCLEKSDLVARIRETMDKEPKGPRTEQRVPMGTFTCSTVYNSPKPDYIVILSHGLGANADDLLPIATSFIDRITAKVRKKKERKGQKGNERKKRNLLEDRERDCFSILIYFLD